MGFCCCMCQLVLALKVLIDLPTVYVLPKTYNDARLFLQSAADNKLEALGNSLSRDKEGPDADDKAVFPCVNMIQGVLVGEQPFCLKYFS